MNKNLIILIPHYNSLNELKESLSSIDESISLDIIIVDDGSQNRPDVTQLEKYFKNGKIYLELLPENLGIEKALNHGLRKIKTMGYTYIGRLDAGDLCYPNKFTKQLAYLEKNKDVYLLGTWVEAVDENLNFLFKIKHPVHYHKIKKKMYINSTFVHPTVVFRTEVIERVGFYPENYKSAEDYAFFFNILKSYKVENYPEVLLKYIISPNSISTKRRKQQVKSRLRIIKDNFHLGFYPAYGLLRNLVLFLLPRSSTTFFKKFIP